MGDRANVAVVQHDGSRVYLYTHWGGYGLPVTVREALATDRGRGRWADEAYLARIIFCQMLGDPEELTGETGFGISTHICDNDGYMVIVVDTKKREVSVEPLTYEMTAPGPAIRSCSLDEYVKMSDEEVMRFTGREEGG